MVNETLIIAGLIFLFVLVYIGFLATVGVFRRNKTLQATSGEKSAHLEVIPKQRPPAPPEPVKETPKYTETLEWEAYDPEIHSDFVAFFGGDEEPTTMLTKRKSFNKYCSVLGKTTIDDLLYLPKFKHPDLFDFIDEFVGENPSRCIESILSDIHVGYSGSGDATCRVMFNIIDVVYSHLDTNDVEYGPAFDKNKIRNFVKAYNFNKESKKLDLEGEFWFVDPFVRYSLYRKILDRNIAVLANLKEKQKESRKSVTDKARARAIKNRYRDPRVRLQQPPVLFEGKRK